LNNQKIIFLIPVVIFILSTSLYILFIINFDNLGMSNDSFANSLRIFREIPNSSILFLGNSQTRENIDCSYIETKQKACFNFGLAGILPIQLAIQSDIIINSHPDIVVIGVSPLFFNEEINTNNDLFFLLNDFQKVNPDKFIYDRLNQEELKLLTMNKWESALYKRKFILPFYFGLVRQLFYSEEKRKIDNNFKNPYLFTESQSEIKLIEKINNPNIMSIFDIYTSSKRQREAFVYLIKKLRDNDIKVIIIQMPINPLVSKKLNQKYVEDFHNYLKKVSTTYNIPLINLEDNFPKEEFIDLTHLNQQGRENLSQRIARGDYHII